MKYLFLFAITLSLFSTLISAQESDVSVGEQFITGIYPEFEVAQYLFKDLNNDRYDEFILIGKQGQIQTYSCKSKDGDFWQIGDDWSLPLQNQTLMSLSSFDVNDTDLHLICLTPDGLIAYPSNQDSGVHHGRRVGMAREGPERRLH